MLQAAGPLVLLDLVVPSDSRHVVKFPKRRRAVRTATHDDAARLPDDQDAFAEKRGRRWCRLGRVLLMALRVRTDQQPPDLHSLIIGVVVVDPTSHIDFIGSKGLIHKTVDRWWTLPLSRMRCDRHATRVLLPTIVASATECRIAR